MKRTLFYILLPLAVSCAKVSDIDNLQKQIDDLTNTQIASISLQISNIQGSIGELTEVDTELNRLMGGLRQDFAGMEETETARYQELKQALEGLEREEAALDQRIKDLKTYCDTRDEGTKDWVTASFVTLEQQGAVLEEIAGIKIRLGELAQMISDTESRLNAAIGRVESSVKVWVSGQLTGYYTIAQMAARLKVLEEGYEAGDETLSTEISTLRNSIGTARTDLTSAYQAAIASAIEENKGVINARIAADIKTATDNMQGQIDAIKLRLDNIESRLSALETSVDQLIGMLQSIAVIPDFSDGSVLIGNTEDNQIRFEVYPLEAAAAIAEKGPSILSLDYVETLTKSSEDFVNLPVSSVSFTGKALLLTVDGTPLSAGVMSGKSSANARLKISDGKVAKSSMFFPLLRKNYDVVPIEDEAFLAYLLENFDSNGDGYLQKSEAESIRRITLGERGVKSLSGIEYMPHLQSLDCSGNLITEMDLTANTSLVSLNVNGCPISSLKIFDSIDSLIGQYVWAGREWGVIFHSSDGKVKIVSIDEALRTWGYYGTTTGAKSASDGESNTNKIPDSPAAQWCRAKGSAWYLPATDELLSIYNNKSKLNATFSYLEGTLIQVEDYWSSREYDAYSPYHVVLSGSNGGLLYVDRNKKREMSVRAVRVL